MSNPWLALRVGADPAERIGQVRQAHEAFIATGSTNRRPDQNPDQRSNFPPRTAKRVPGEIGDTVRGVVADSWRRSVGALVDPDTTAPVELSDDDLAEYRAAHPLAQVLPLFRDLLGGIAEDGEHLMAVCDAGGRLLWVEGHSTVLRTAAGMNFVPGARWDERHAGTNAPGTALAVDHSVQIFATEHFSRPVQRWTCVAAPIHDPRTGALIGAIDLTGGDHLANPHSLALVQATARAAETLLAGSIRPVTGGASVLSLGRDEATITVAGHRTRLGRRHSELLVLLLCHPEGRSGEQLAFDLYGDDHQQPVTLRAELSRLRRTLGPALVGSRPYRIEPGVEADFLTVTRLLDLGLVGEALRAYAGPLLPGSEAPGVVRLRRMIDGQLRAAVLASGDVALLDSWVRAPWGADDLASWEALVSVLPPATARHRLAVTRLTQLAVDYGLLRQGYDGATFLQRSGI